MNNLEATRTSRIVSYLIDTFILVLLLLPIIYFYTDIAGINPEETNKMDYFFIWQYPLELLYLELISLLVVFSYFAFLPIIMEGQTIGRKAMNIAIVSEDGSPVNMKNMFIREFVLLTLINSLTGGLLFFIGSLFILRENKRALYDEWSKTKLVQV